MGKRISVRLTEDEMAKLNAVEGETTTEKIKNLLDGSYLQKHMDMDMSMFSRVEQSYFAMGLLIAMVYGTIPPEKLVKDYIPKFDKGDVLPLYRRVINHLYKEDEENKYEDLLAFISEGFAIAKANPDKNIDIGLLRVLGQSLVGKFKL